MNLKIVKACWEVVQGSLVTEGRGGFCLRFVRQVVEHAYGWKAGDFYRRFHTHTVEENTTTEPWARDLERSMRSNGMAVKDPQAGDMIFDYKRAKPYGHVALMLSNSMVLELSPTRRGFARGNINLVTLKEWGTPTTVIRLKE
jgi:hypothetical protein